MLNVLLLFLQLKGLNFARIQKKSIKILFYFNGIFLNTSKIQLFLEQVLILMSKSDNYGSETEQNLFS